MIISTGTLACRNIGSGRKRAAFWRSLGFPNLMLARAAKANKRGLRLLEEWKQKQLQRTPFAILDEQPSELRPKKGGSDGWPRLSRNTYPTT